VKDVNSDLIADSQNVLNRWNYLSQLFHVHRVSDVRQMEIHAAEPLVPDPTVFEDEISNAKLKRSSPGGDQILAKLIQARSELLRSINVFSLE
jgi:hypothetical protein